MTKAHAKCTRLLSRGKLTLEVSDESHEDHEVLVLAKCANTAVSFVFSREFVVIIATLSFTPPCYSRMNAHAYELLARTRARAP